MNLVTDKEIVLNRDNDLLGTKGYAQNLKDIIRNIPKDTESSFTIGLFGEWGSGKSSIINTAKKDLENSSDQKIKFVVYDAWKYANDSFRRMLLLKLQKSLRFNQTKLLNSFYLNESEDVEIIKELDISYILLVALFTTVALFLIFQPKITTEFKITIPVLLSLAIFTTSFLKKAFDEFKINIQKPHLFAPEQFEECFEEMTSKSLKKYNKIEALKKWVDNDNHIKGLDKLIIVIDNIDRCHKELSYELLTNIKNFLGKNKNIIFIIPVDDDALKKHINNNNNNIDSQEANEFLRKFFNIVVRLKYLKRYDIYSFAKKINDKHELGFSPNTIDVIGKEYASNPRRIIQFYNNLATELTNFENDFKEENETAICKMLIIKEEWPKYFKQICKNPFLLNTPDKQTNDIINEDNSLFAFLNKTTPITKRISTKRLNKIIQNSDDLSDIPESIVEAVEDGNINLLYDFINNSKDKHTLIIDYLIEGIKSYIENQRYTSALNNFQVIVQLNEQTELSQSENRRIQSEIYLDMPQLVSIWSNSVELLVSYSEQLNQKNIRYLKEYLIESVNNEYKSTEKYENINEMEIELLNNMTQSYTDKRSLVSLSDSFTKEYTNNEVRISSLDIDNDSLTHLISHDTLKFIISNIKEVNSEDWAIDEIEYLLQNLEFEASTFDLIFEKINQLHPNFTNQPKDNIIKIISALQKILSNTPSYSYEFEYFSGFYTQIFANRTVQNRNAELLQEVLSLEDDVNTCIDFLYQVYRITQSKISTKTEFEILFNTNNFNENIKDKFIKLKDIDHYSLAPVKQIILSDNSHDKQCIELLKHILNHKRNNKYIVSEEELSKKLEILTSRLINDDSLSGIKSLLISEVKDNRFKETLASIISKKTKNEILSIPIDLQQLAFDYLCSENILITDYKDEQELLLAIGKSGNQKHINALTKVVLEKLVHNDNRQALEIIDTVSSFPKTDKDKLIPHIEELFDNEDFSEIAHNTIQKFNGALKKDSIFIIEEGEIEEE